MQKFNNYDEFIEITKLAQQNQQKNINCYLMPNEINELIIKEKLYYLQNNTTLQIIRKHDRFYNVSFYATEKFNFTLFDSNLPIITDIPYSIKICDKIKLFVLSLQKQGFKLNCESSRMRKKNTNIDTNKINNNFKIDNITEQEIDKVYEIWESNFNYLTDLLYSKNEIQEHKNDIYVCKDDNGNILGAMEILLKGNNAWIQKIAIKNELKGKGIGTIMENFYINKCKTLGINSLLLYTINDNMSAQNFHKKFGFNFDGKHNCQYLYLGEKNGQINGNLN